MDKVNIGYDDNLGLPSDFADEIGCEIIAYHDLGKMIDAFEQKKLFAMFIPAGTLPYVKNYKPIAQSLFGPKHQTTLQTNFVSVENMTLSEIPQFAMGRVNQYCTTSFWAPLIYLMKYLPQYTVLTFKNANSFPDMLHKTAEKIIDCSMVWDIILHQHPQDADKVHELFHKADLPTPVIVNRIGEQSDIEDKLTKFMTQDSKAFFSGFQAPDLNAIHQFVSDMKNAADYFKVKAE